MATNTGIEACKSAKRKRRPRPYGFQEFPSSGSIVDFFGPFRENIRLFVQEYAEIEDYTVSGMPVWSTLLIDQSNGFDVVFPLYTIEETVQNSPHPFCDHCKCIGWSHHFVSKRRYHLIIPSADQWKKPLRADSLDLRSHTLHGLVHCNGFGHLLNINGLEVGSNFLRGSDVMDLWDRLCTTLRTRTISVCDVSEKRFMDLRLLHGVAYGCSWFGNWGYKFGCGSFGVTEDKYDKAVEFLSTLPIDKLVNDVKNRVQRRIKHIVKSYREISETPLVTVSDLLQFMLAYKSKAAVQRNTAKELVKNAYSKTQLKKLNEHDSKTLDNPINFQSFVASLRNSDSKWPERRLEYAMVVIVKLLKEKKTNSNGNSSLSRHELREEARQFIGDTGLIDFVLKSITCVAMGNQIVLRATNPSTKLLEFTLHEVVKETKSNKFPSSILNSDCRWPEQRLEHAAEVIVSTLKENKAMVNGKNTMSRHELREAARQCIGDTGLIDFVLKSMNNSIVGNQIVHRLKNPSTKVTEFAIQDIVYQRNVETITRSESPSLELDLDVNEDIMFFYKNVLLSHHKSDLVSLAAQVVLDTKQFVKEWLLQTELKSQRIMLTCKVLPSFDELDKEFTRPLSPGELVVVSPFITIRELKVVAQCALRDTYSVMDNFIVEQIGGLKGIADERVLSSAVESGSLVWIRGSGLDLDTELRYEGGNDNWKVDCLCGARFDDGERMVACDFCQVWQHTRCSGIDDDMVVASSFKCARCIENSTRKRKNMVA